MHLRNVVIAMCVVLSMAGCADDSAPTVAPNISPAHQADAGRSMGLTFPSTTRFLLYHRESGGMDDAIFLKIELPSTALSEFLSQPTFVNAKWSTTLSRIPDMPKWKQWQPGSITRFRSEQFSLPKNQALNVLIDDERAD